MDIEKEIDNITRRLVILENWFKPPSGPTASVTLASIISDIKDLQSNVSDMSEVIATMQSRLNELAKKVNISQPG